VPHNQRDVAAATETAASATQDDRLVEIAEKSLNFFEHAAAAAREALGVDAGADGARTMMLVYNLPRTDAIYQQFNGIAGAAYVVTGLGMTALTSGDEKLVVVPIRSGLGLRLGYNVGYLKFTSAPTWNPF
jgi:hypothetical protein